MGIIKTSRVLVAFTRLDLAAEQAALWRLGQSSFAVRIAGQSVLLDPFLSPVDGRLEPPPFPPEAASGIDVIACTHEHLDHFDAAALPTIMEASPAARIVVPAPIVDLALGLGIPAERVIAARAGIAMDFGSFTIHPVRAKHGVHVDDAYSFGEKLSGGEARFLGYVLESAGVRIFHAGDSLVYEGMAERLKELRVDVALLPINGRDYYRESQDIVGNMDPREALELAARAGVDIVVPMHYEMFTENLGYAAHLVEVATRFFPGISIALLTKERPFIYSSLGFPKSELEFR